jgi:glycosyltransferase involved in cell wall biosynthesis
MAMPVFRSRTSLAPEGFGQRATPPSPRESLAIVSTRSKLCGVAAYTAALRRQLDDAFDITVFDLDQYLLRSQHRRVRKLADHHIKEICHAIRDFDAVNLQLEHGTLGRHGNDIHRRFCWLTAAAPRLSVTFHTLPMPPSFDGTTFMKALVRGKFKAAARMQAEFHRTHVLSHGIARQLRRIQRYKQVSAIVHNMRDFRDVKYLYGVRHVFDHPLSYLTAAEIDAVRNSAARRCFPILDGLPSDVALIGVFGFLNEYKGIGTAIEALQYLPDNHHLLVFGGIHPQEIMPRQPRHPYLASLFDNAYMDTTLYDRLSAGGAASPPQLTLTADQGLRELVGAHPRDLSARIHFMGALSEKDFLSGMAICDAVVFPYLEVGQSSSGPISQALELGCRIIASRTHTFLEFAEYHKNSVEFFDIGNHLELAERLIARRQFSPRGRLPEFNIETNKATYLLANHLISGGDPGLGRTHSPVLAHPG